jgi:2-polyprenyl-6-methoxyphenol hydroxylase-like FAD-dependent oxidoreductase
MTQNDPELDAEVIVVGAGPVGLALAVDLALAGVRARVLERRPHPGRGSRAMVLHARTLELFDMRGRADSFVAAGFHSAYSPYGSDRARVAFGRLASRFPYQLVIPQTATEDLLREWFVELGGEVDYGSEVTGLEQDADGVTVTVGGPAGPRLRAAYVVGCDGVYSAVRESLGIPFDGFTFPNAIAVADTYLDRMPADDVYSRNSETGYLLIFPFLDGRYRVVVYDFARADVGVDEPVTLEEIREAMIRVIGDDLGIRDPSWLSRFRPEERQASSYRDGRVFLAGDAAHVHSPAGAQGLNVGVQDAMNLSWKLTATLRGWAPAGLLDTYQSERHPAAAYVIRTTGVQFRFNNARQPHRRLLRWLAFHVALPLPPVQRRLAAWLAGIGFGYPPEHTLESSAAAHPWAGRRMPDVPVAGSGVTGPGGGSRLFEHTGAARFVLLADEGVPGLDTITKPWADRVRHVRHAATGGRLPRVALVRPDGYVAWASDTADDALVNKIPEALTRWCGVPSS